MSNVLSVSTMFVTLLRTYKLNFEASTKALSRIVIRLPREANGMCDQVCTGVAHLRRCRCRGEQALAGARSLLGHAEDNLGEVRRQNGDTEDMKTPTTWYRRNETDIVGTRQFPDAVAVPSDGSLCVHPRADSYIFSFVLVTSWAVEIYHRRYWAEELN